MRKRLKKNISQVEFERKLRLYQIFVPAVVAVIGAVLTFLGILLTTQRAAQAQSQSTGAQKSERSLDRSTGDGWSVGLLLLGLAEAQTAPVRAASAANDSPTLSLERNEKAKGDIKTSSGTPRAESAATDSPTLSLERNKKAKGDITISGGIPRAESTANDSPAPSHGLGKEVKGDTAPSDTVPHPAPSGSSNPVGKSLRLIAILILPFYFALYFVLRPVIRKALLNRYEIAPGGADATAAGESNRTR